MKHSAAQAGAWIVRQMTKTPVRASLTRYFLSLGFVAAVFAIIPHTPIDGPVGGVLALFSVIVCCWYSGVGPALLMPATVWFVSRFPFDDATRPLIPSAHELMTFVGLTSLTGAVGLAGQFRNRLHSTTREHNARMREQAQALSAARIVFRDLDGRITTWTEGAEQLYGWKRDEAAGRLIQELLHTTFPAPQKVIHTQLLQEGQWRGEVTQIGKDGQRLNVVTHCIVYASEDTGHSGVAEVHTDVTNLRLAEAAIRESDRRKDLFVATLAHELRNPLAPLRSGLDVLQMTRSGSSDDDDVLEVMQRQLEHMVRMVDDLLDVSRINTGKVELRLGRVRVADIVRDAVNSCRPQLDEARLNLTVNVPVEDIFLHADAARLVQVLMNLLSNAAKFTEAGGDICLSAGLDGQQVVIRVQDTGSGITAESLPHIFEMFAQVEDPHVGSTNGLGLGLNIVRTLVEMHGGTVEAHSKGLGRGTEFLVQLPAIVDHTSIDVDFQQGNSARNGQPVSQRVLVVDDNRDAARLLSVMLTKSGFDCRIAFDGPTALAMAGEFDPHTVLLDLGMPGMNGLEVAQRLRSNTSDNGLLLIAVTGWDKEDDRQRTLEAGFDHHLAKPVPIGMLQELIGSANANDQRWS